MKNAIIFNTEPSNLQLAEHKFNKPSKIVLLIKKKLQNYFLTF